MRKLVLLISTLFISVLSVSAEYVLYDKVEDFENVKWAICEAATDGCNNYFLTDWKVVGGTKMACSPEFKPEWSCTKFKDNIVTTEAMPVTTSLDDAEAPVACTMEYAPMCWVDWVTYGNKCTAGKKEIAYAWECDTYINTAKLANYKKTTAKYDKKLAKVKTEKLEKWIEKVNKMIETIKLTKMAKEAIIKKVTEYTFIKYLFENELSKR